MKKLWTILTVAMGVAFLTPNLSAQTTVLAETQAQVDCNYCPTEDCWFRLQVLGPPSPDACGGTGYSSITVSMDAISPDPGPNGEECVADLDRASTPSSGGTPSITWTICNGPTCSMTSTNFPDNSPFPYGPGSPQPLPPGKVALSPACYNSLTSAPNPTTQNDVVGFDYTMSNVSGVNVNFGIGLHCICDSTWMTVDALSIEYNSTYKRELEISGTNIDSPKGLYLGQSYPNPANSFMTIDLSLPEGVDNYVLSINDLTGREVKRLEQSGSQGLNSLMIDTRNIAEGTYTYSLIAGGLKLNKTMVITH